MTHVLNLLDFLFQLLVLGLILDILDTGRDACYVRSVLLLLLVELRTRNKTGGMVEGSIGMDVLVGWAGRRLAGHDVAREDRGPAAGLSFRATLSCLCRR